jgi:RNA polymerase sigma-70 factor (ECF subfamily)
MDGHGELSGGPEEVFADFLAADYGRLVGAVTLVTGSRDEARDAVDEALARAWAQVRRGRGPDSLGAWVRVVALNLARGRFRHRAVEERARARLAGVGEDRDHAALGALNVDARRALAALPRRQREVTVLFYFLDLPVAEIARELKVDEGTVKNALHRARAALRVTLADHGTDDAGAAEEQEVSHDVAG